MSATDAIEALRSIGIHATRPPGARATGYFPLPAAPGVDAGRRSAGFVERTFDRLELRDGPARGSAEFAGGLLRAITWVHSVADTADAVRQVLQGLEREFGLPSQSNPERWNVNGLPVATWENARTSLAVATYPQPDQMRSVVVAFTRLPREWP